MLSVEDLWKVLETKSRFSFNQNAYLDQDQVKHAFINIFAQKLLLNLMANFYMQITFPSIIRIVL
ncbi:MAG: hypothetical protein HWD61_04340 [Parachlamydiaceae bacterium]|nr:MAG: hypothetical protein HWD61_04340 [Parachlamydiaceae bacterium]